MWTRKILKQNGKIAFKRNYWACVAVCVIALLLGGITSGGSGSSGISDFGGDTAISDSNDGELPFGAYDELPDEITSAFPDYTFSEETEEDTVQSLAEIFGTMFMGIPSYVWGLFGAVLLVAFAIGIALSILIANPVKVGCNRFFIENREHKTAVGQLFHSFKGGRYGSTVFVMFMKDLYVFLWGLLLIIPGVLKSYSYALVPYILAENTDLDKGRVLKMSSEMMKGHRWELFVLELSFFGWALLGAITFGILDIFYVNPYMKATLAEFYSAVKAEAIQNGTVSPEELPGVSIPVEAVEVV